MNTVTIFVMTIRTSYATSVAHSLFSNDAAMVNIPIMFFMLSLPDRLCCYPLPNRSGWRAGHFILHGTLSRYLPS